MKIKLTTPVTVCTYAEITGTEINATSVIVTVLYGNSTTGYDISNELTKKLTYPVGANVDSILANTRTKAELDTAILTMVATDISYPEMNGTLVD
jgi:hypothetical protein